MVVIIPNAIVKCGAATNDCVTISNVRRIQWEPQPGEYSPQLVMNTTTPVAWHRPHKWLRGELHVLSEAYDAFFNNGTGHVAYIVPNGNNTEFPYFEVDAVDKDGKTWTYVFTGLIPIDYSGTFIINEEVVHVYAFVAKYVTTNKPA
jgi:hypothetical protein